MAIIKCSECGHDISDTAKTCPSCGYIKSSFNKLTKQQVEQIRSFTYTKKKPILLSIGVLVLLAAVYIIVMSSPGEGMLTSLAAGAGIFLIAAMITGAILYNAYCQRTFELNKMKITYYNQLIEKMYTASEHDSNSDGQTENPAANQFLIEKRKAVLYASEEVVELLNQHDKPDISALMLAIRNDLAGSGLKDLSRAKIYFGKIVRPASSEHQE